MPLANSQTENHRLSHLRAKDTLLSQIASGGLGTTTSILCEHGRPYLFAGAVRDALLSSLTDIPVIPRDFDVGVQGVSAELFHELCSRLNGERNRYGGYRIESRLGATIDIWQLEKTIGTEITSSSPTLSNVLRSFVLNVNAVAFDLQTHDFYDLGVTTAIEHRTIDLLPNPLYHSHGKFAARGILLALRLCFGVSRSLEVFIRTHFETEKFDYEVSKLALADDAPLSKLLVDAGNLSKSRLDKILDSIKERSATRSKSACASLSRH